MYRVLDAAPNNEKALNSSASLCTVCGRALGKNPLYFEVNTSWELIVPGSDNNNSQGYFPVGQSCASRFTTGLLLKLA